MQKTYKERILKMIEEGFLDEELLVNCVAKLNRKITRKYRNVRTSEANLGMSGYNSIYAENVKEFNQLVEYRKPILDALMKSYRISLEEVKLLVKKTDDDNLPTYAMIDAIRESILSGAYMCI